MLKIKRIRISIPLITLFLLIMVISVSGQSLQEIMKNQVLLSNGWKLTPVGKMMPLGDLPLNIAVSPSGKMIAVTNNGQSTQSIQLIDSKSVTMLDSVEIGKSWLGLTFSKDEKSLYASGGNDNWIIQYRIKDNKLIANDTIVIGNPWPEKISVAGIAVDDKKNLLYAVTKENNSLYVVDLKEKKIQKQLPLGGEGYTCLLSKDAKTLYATCWGCDKVILFDTRKQEISGWIPVGDNPNDMCMTRNGKFLFVSNANDNSVSVISLEEKKVIEVLNTSLYPGSPQGSTANSVALSENDKTLYIANADNNCLAVFDVSEPGESFSKGFIPTGWYPTSVRVVDNTVFIANGKGLTSKAESAWTKSDGSERTC